MLSSKDHSRGSETSDQESLTTCFIQVLWRPKQRIGGVAEWFKATVLKTVDCNRSMSSNPIASAILLHRRARLLAGFVVSGGWERPATRSQSFGIVSAIPQKTYLTSPRPDEVIGTLLNNLVMAHHYKEHDWEHLRQALAQAGLFDEKPARTERLALPAAAHASPSVETGTTAAVCTISST